MLFKVYYYFVADKGKSLICGVLKVAEMIDFYVYAEFQIILKRIYSNEFLHSSLKQSCFIKVLVQVENLMFSSKKVKTAV